MKPYLKSALFIFAWVLLSQSLSGQWSVDSISSKASLNGISISEDGSGWIVGSGGTMLYKEDNGWIESEPVTDVNLYSVCMISEFNGWAVGAKGTILNYDGNSWVKVESPTREGLLSVSFNDPFNGIAVGIHGTRLTFSNGRWHAEDKMGRENLFCAAYTDNIMVIGGGGEAVSVPLIKTNNQFGRSKVVREGFDPGYISIKALHIISMNDIWAVGLPGAIFHHRGNGWQRIRLSENVPSLNGVCFSDETYGVAVGNNGSVMIYSDGNWKRDETPVSHKLNGIASLGNTFYAIGENGVILSHTRKLEKLAEKPLTDNALILIQNYPNPAGRFTNIVIPDEFHGREGRLFITNPAGQVVYARDMQEMISGDVQPINIERLSSGIYFIKIESAGISAFGKLIIGY